MPEKSAWAQWSESDIKDIVQPMIDASIAKIPAPVIPPATGYAAYSVKDWMTLLAAAGAFLTAIISGFSGHLNQTAIKSTVDAVQQTQAVQDKKADEVKVALNTATNEQKKSFKAQSDSLGDSLKIVAEAREAAARDVEATPEDKKIAADARAAYQAHLDRQKNGH